MVKPVFIYCFKVKNNFCVKTTQCKNTNTWILWGLCIYMCTKILIIMSLAHRNPETNCTLLICRTRKSTENDIFCDDSLESKKFCSQEFNTIFFLNFPLTFPCYHQIEIQFYSMNNNDISFLSWRRIEIETSETFLKSTKTFVFVFYVLMGSEWLQMSH